MVSQEEIEAAINDMKARYEKNPTLARTLFDYEHVLTKAQIDELKKYNCTVKHQVPRECTW